MARQTFPGFATGRSAGDPVSRPKEGMPLKGRQARGGDGQVSQPSDLDILRGGVTEEHQLILYQLACIDKWAQPSLNVANWR